MPPAICRGEPPPVGSMVSRKAMRVFVPTDVFRRKVSLSMFWGYLKAFESLKMSNRIGLFRKLIF